MSSTSIMIAGFGGQGILFIGKMLAYQAMLENKHVCWLPSYGPEMRGGTANCNVIISNKPVGSPVIDNPKVLIAMNLPSLDKYEKTVAKGGKIFLDSSLIERKVERDDVDVYYVPAAKLADETGDSRLGNMVMLGKVIKETKCVDYNNVADVLNKTVSARHKDLIDINLKILDVGYNF